MSSFRAIAFLAVASLFSACATGQATRTDVELAPGTDPASIALVDRYARLHHEARREEARRLLEEIVDHDDEPETQREMIVRAHDLAPEVLLDLPPSSLASLAPAVLRVYHVVDALGPRTAPSALDGDDALVQLAATEAERLDAQNLERLRALLGEQLGRRAWPRGRALLAARGAWLVVMPARGRYDEVKRALDRFATAGGGSLEVRIDLLRDGGAVARGLGFDPLEETRDVRLPADVARRAADSGWREGGVTLVVPWGRLAVAETVLTGADDASDGESVEIGAAIGPLARDGAPRLEARVRFPTDDDEPEPIVARVPLRFGDATFVYRARGLGLLIRVLGRPADAAPVRPAWRRLEPRETPDPFAPLGDVLATAIDLADASIRAGDAADAANRLETALRLDTDPDFTRRITLGRAPVEVAILTRRVAGAPPDLLKRLAEAGVRPAATAGFLTVLGDTLAGCVDPASLGALDRVLVVVASEDEAAVK